MVDVGRDEEGLTSETVYGLGLGGRSRRACVGERGLGVRYFLSGRFAALSCQQLSQYGFWYSGFASFVDVGPVEALSMPVPVPLSAIDRPCMSRPLPSVAWICPLPYSREAYC